VAERLGPLDISHLTDVRRLAEEVRASATPRALQIDHETVAILTPVSEMPAKGRRGRAAGADDPLWNIVGLGQSNGSGDVAENVDAYLAQAYISDEE
jgi:hypothetical protein